MYTSIRVCFVCTPEDETPLVLGTLGAVRGAAGVAARKLLIADLALAAVRRGLALARAWADGQRPAPRGVFDALGRDGRVLLVRGRVRTHPRH